MSAQWTHDVERLATQKAASFAVLIEDHARARAIRAVVAAQWGAALLWAQVYTKALGCNLVWLFNELSAAPYTEEQCERLGLRSAESIVDGGA